MEYRYSTVVDPSTYETEGLCDGIPLRVRRGQEMEDLGAIRAQEDWTKHVGPAGFVKASLGPEYNFLSVAFPEMLPGRMEVLAYFDEFIFLHDDKVEAVDKLKVCIFPHPPFVFLFLTLPTDLSSSSSSPSSSPFSTSTVSQLLPNTYFLGR